MSNLHGLPYKKNIKWSTGLSKKPFIREIPVVCLSLRSLLLKGFYHNRIFWPFEVSPFYCGIPAPLYVLSSARYPFSNEIVSVSDFLQHAY